jgi:hypothetical protein
VAHDIETPRDAKAIDAVPIDQAFLSIPDEDNEAIIDARKTFLVVLASAAAFIAIVFVFVL